MLTTVVVPTYNESLNIAPLLEEIFACLAQVDHPTQVLVVDDHSPDGTPTLVRQLQDKFPRLFLLERVGIRGRGTAGTAGFSLALKLGSTQVVEMDADFSHPPSILPSLIAGLSQSDVTIASRLTDRSEDSRPWLRRWITWGANVYARLLMQKRSHPSKIRDWTTGYRAYRMSVFKMVPPETMLSTGPCVLQEMLFRAFEGGLTAHEIPFSMKDRERGVSTFNRKVALESIRNIWRFRRGLKPLDFSGRPVIRSTELITINPREYRLIPATQGSSPS